MRYRRAQEFEGLCNGGIIGRSRVNCYLQIVASSRAPPGRHRRRGIRNATGERRRFRSREQEARMKVRRTFIMWWTILSILFVAFIAVRHENDLKRQFEQASTQQ